MKTETSQLSAGERLNFLLTNRLPRRGLTLFMGWYSRIESPLLTRLSIAIWQLFADDLRLQDAKARSFKSLRDCFTRELKDGLRPIDHHLDVVCSPCDAVVGAFGRMADTRVYQAKGFPYLLEDLMPDPAMAETYRNGSFMTLRLKSSMYHRFHAPVDCRVTQVNYISGDTWNVNPIALKQVETLFCKNERAVVELDFDKPGFSIALVPVAAILVASMKFHCLSHPLDLRYRGANRLPCDAHFSKGQEMGYFQHGSTILVFATSQYQLNEELTEGSLIKVGESLFTGHPLPQNEHTATFDSEGLCHDVS